MGMHHRLVMMIIRPAEKEKMCDQNIGKIFFLRRIPIWSYFYKYIVLVSIELANFTESTKNSWNQRTLIFIPAIKQ